jgi:hypothetical protein
VPDLATALAHSRRLFDEQEIDRAVSRIAVDIRNDYAGERPVYLTVMHGGLPFAALLAMKVGIDLEFDYLHATRYRGALTGSGLAWLHRPATPIAGRRVLLERRQRDEAFAEALDTPALLVHADQLRARRGLADGLREFGDLRLRGEVAAEQDHAGAAGVLQPLALFTAQVVSSDADDEHACSGAGPVGPWSWKSPRRGRPGLSRL